MKTKPCNACQAIVRGIKTEMELIHTCGRTDSELHFVKQVSNPDGLIKFLNMMHVTVDPNENLNIEFNRKKLILKALNAYGRNETASFYLGISSRTLLRDKRRYNIQYDEGTQKYFTT